MGRILCGLATVYDVTVPQEYGAENNLSRIKHWINRGVPNTMVFAFIEVYQPTSKLRPADPLNKMVEKTALFHLNTYFHHFRSVCRKVFDPQCTSPYPT